MIKEELCALSTKWELFGIELGIACMACSAERERKVGEAEHRGVDNDRACIGHRVQWSPVKYTQTIERRRAWQRRRSQLHALLDTTAGVTGCHIKRKNGPKFDLSITCPPNCPPNCPAPLILMDVTS
jgi:hypothetical protein